jgi:uncharacterized protein YfaP (DUF2135 family)
VENNHERIYRPRRIIERDTTSVRRDRKRIWRGKCPSDPKLLAEVIRHRAPAAERVVFETGPLSVWFYHALSAERLRQSVSTPAMRARHGPGGGDHGRQQQAEDGIKNAGSQRHAERVVAEGETEILPDIADRCHQASATCVRAVR